MPQLIQHCYSSCNSVTTHEAYCRNFEKDRDSAVFSHSQEMYMKMNYVITHKWNTIVLLLVQMLLLLQLNQAYGSSFNVNYDTADNVYEECQEYSYV